MASSVAPSSRSSLCAGTTKEINSPTTRLLDYPVTRLSDCDARALRRDALPAPVAHDEHVDVAERQRLRLALARARELLLEEHDRGVAVDLDVELVELRRIDLLVE